ncbi:MAG: guanylate kinase [Acidimicrobiia bacterium]
MAGRLIVVSGPSGSGKSSILRALSDLVDFEFSVSATTRPPRPGEVDGVHYHFMNRDAFERLIADGSLLEWAVYNNNYYGTPAGPIDEALALGDDILLDIEIQGARQVKESRPDAMMIFIVPPSRDELERRLRHRGDTSEEDIQDRLAVVASQMAEAKELFDHTVVNDDLHEATAEVANLINEPR